MSACFWAFLLISLVIRVLPHVENFIVEKARNMNIYVEFDSLDNLGEIIGAVKALDVQIYDVDIDHGRQEKFRSPSAVFSIRLHNRQVHHPRAGGHLRAGVRPHHRRDLREGRYHVDDF